LFLFKGLHSLAAPRGDGLRPELLELAARREAPNPANVVEFASRLDGGFLQAGPNPKNSLHGNRPPNVVRFCKIEQDGEK
jgi:hypothetical protein